jgi:hypothetical protein
MDSNWLEHYKNLLSKQKPPGDNDRGIENPSFEIIPQYNRSQALNGA